MKPVVMRVREVGIDATTLDGVYDVPPGYKQTEVGVIPQDWEVRLLVDLARVRTGIAKNSRRELHNPVQVHYLRVANVQDAYLTSLRSARSE